MRIAVSACLLGHACKYNGGSNLDPDLLERLVYHDLVPVCPEVLGGLSTPRPRSEILDGRVVNELGQSVDAAFRTGAERALAQIELAGGVDLAILQPRSPSCGVGRIYDGTFSGVLVDGDGIFVQLLRERGVPVVSAEGPALPGLVG